VKAARLHAYDSSLTRDELVTIDELPEPALQEPDDVLVRIGGAGLCRTDLHIIEGLWRTKVDRSLPYVLGHENAGWVHAVGERVKTVKPGDPVLVHPLITDGTCPACRRGEDMHCTAGRFPGITHDGGFAEYLLTKERSVLLLPPGLEPRDVAPHADAGLTAYRAARKLAATLRPGMTAVVLGFGGLGHIAAQVLRSLCAARILVADVSEPARALARDLGFPEVLGGEDLVAEVRRLCPEGVEAVLDFVGERGTPEQGLSLLRRGGTYSVIGYGGTLHVPTMDLIVNELSILGNLVGSYSELRELLHLAATGQVKLATQVYRLEQINEAMHDLAAGRVRGRAVLVP
jgi:NAD+-dependent secondary alcohol dehydrogenase Adh1